MFSSCNVYQNKLLITRIVIHAPVNVFCDAGVKLFNDARQLAINFPECVELREVYAGRQLQLERLHLVWLQLSSTAEDRGGGPNEPEGESVWLAGCLGRFMDGVRAPTPGAHVHGAITGRIGTFGVAGNGGAATHTRAPAAQPGGAAGGSGGEIGRAHV